jgi:ATP-dependent Clp protease ATP-binding subunit ClpA
MAKVLERAREEAMNMTDEFVSLEHLFLGILSSETFANNVLEKAVYLKQTTTEGEAAAAKMRLDYNTALKVFSQIILVAGIEGTEDKVYICKKGADENYNWVEI